jgi:hypothetical protein
MPKEVRVDLCEGQVLRVFSPTNLKGGINASKRTATLRAGGTYDVRECDPPPTDGVPAPEPPVITNSDIVGYGSTVTGGTSKPVALVTNLNDSGAGSLREALSTDNRDVRFSVSGSITLNSDIRCSGFDNVTVDGSTAPGEGITIRNYSLVFTGPPDLSNGCNNIIVRHLAFRGQYHVGYNTAALEFSYGTTNFVADHCSFSGFYWRGLNVYDTCSDGTISWCFFGPYGGPVGGPYNAGNGYDYQMHLARKSSRLSVDHCLFFRGSYRHPEFSYSDSDGPFTPTDITGDMANCLIYDDIGGSDHYGTVHQELAKVNIRNSYYYAVPPNNDHNSSIHTSANANSVYLSGVAGKAGTVVTTNSSTLTPYTVASHAVLPLEPSAYDAAGTVKSGAGRFPRDATDTAWAALVSR